MKHSSVVLVGICLFLGCISSIQGLTIDDIFVSTTWEPLENGFDFTEGPVWHFGRDMLLFSDMNADNATYQLDPTNTSLPALAIRKPSDNGNGMALNQDYSLFTCHQSATTHRVTRFDLSTNDTFTLVDSYNGTALNSPNDLALRSDGSIYFTDPAYAGHQELPFNGVYRIHPNAAGITLLATDLTRPNGIALSADETILFVADTQNGIIKRYYLPNGPGDGIINDTDVFIPNVPNPDGIKLDVEGNLYVAASDGLRVYASNGSYIGIAPKAAAASTTNVAFGDSDFKTLYITAGNTVYKLQGKIAGKPTDGRPIRGSSSSTSPSFTDTGTDSDGTGTGTGAGDGTAGDGDGTGTGTGSDASRLNCLFF